MNYIIEVILGLIAAAVIIITAIASVHHIPFVYQGF